MATNQTNDGRLTGQSRTRVRLTAEDEAIFDRRHDSMDAQWLYEDSLYGDERFEGDYARMLYIMRAGIRYDLASPAVRIEG